MSKRDKHLQSCKSYPVTLHIPVYCNDNKALFYSILFYFYVYTRKHFQRIMHRAIHWFPTVIYIFFHIGQILTDIL